MSLIISVDKLKSQKERNRMSIKLAFVIVFPIIMGIISTYCTVNLYSDNLEDTTELRLIVAIWFGVFGSIGILVKMI